MQSFRAIVLLAFATLASALPAQEAAQQILTSATAFLGNRLDFGLLLLS